MKEEVTKYRVFDMRSKLMDREYQPREHDASGDLATFTHILPRPRVQHMGL